ncbi:MAG: hypothetical protein P8179_18460 [Candidatus Thiodiazotropha sp.]|jgi:hypothetical protein
MVRPEIIHCPICLSLISAILSGLMLFLSGCSGGDPTATDPQLIFEDGFENQLSEVEILAEGGTMVRGFSAWLKIAPKQTEIHLRNAADYVYTDCQKPAEWFLGVTGDAGLKLSQSHLTCQLFTEPRFKFNNGRWMVTDNSSGIVYYRIWKLNG